jgi:hypothetical protein
MMSMYIYLSVTIKSSTFQTDEKQSVTSRLPTNNSTNPDPIHFDVTNPHTEEKGNGTWKSLTNCKSTWKLNGNTFHNCTNEAIRGKCICAIEIEPSTRLKIISTLYSQY